MNSLAQKEQEEQQDQNQFVIFQIGSEEYGIDIKQVKEILKPTKITNVPNTDDYILGVINLRGQIIPVIDLSKKFDINVKDNKEEQRIITVEIRESLIGLKVDGVNEVVWLNEDDIEPAPEVAGGIKQEYLKGVGKREDHLLILINLNKLLFTKNEEE